MNSQSQNTNILEAQGQLNKQIQSALQHFRTKLLQNANPTRKQIILKNYDDNKQGPQKSFKFRESLLSLMFEIRDFRTIYNMVVASFIILTLSLLYDSYIEKGEVVDMIALFAFFNGTRTILIAWLSLSVVFYCIILVTKIALKTSKIIWLPIYFTHISVLFYIGTHFSQQQGVGFASVIIIMAQSVRMIMKSHSYLRTKLVYVSDNQYKNFQFRGIKSILLSQISEDRQEKSPRSPITFGDLFTQIRRLSYFFMCPTLIYRDFYTLTPVRSFKNIIVHLVNFLACVYYSFILYQSWCKPVIENLYKTLDIKSLSSTVINLMLPSVLFLIMGFFGFLHSWLNMWSEITRFPDRAFYSDWWNSCEFGSYYRKWNIVVHDWLYYYIYLDLYRFFPSSQKYRAIPQFLTFIISAIIHEVIIYYAIGFFYPILFILFAGPGILFIQSKSLRRTSVNLIFWLEMYIGTAILFTLYLIECFARIKVSDAQVNQDWGSFGFLIPRTVYLGAS